MSKVLIVTPVYCSKENKRLPLLLQCLYGVQNQSHKDFVHVVVDDGSTDETGELLDRIAHSHDNMLVFHQINKGSSAAVNYGVSEALKKINPNFITITHSDDLLTPDSLETRIGKNDFVFTDMLINRNDTLELKKAGKFSSIRDVYDFLLTGGWLPYATMFWSKELFLKIGGYDNELVSAEDMDICLRTIKKLIDTNGDLKSINKVTAIYRHHKNNLWYNNIRNGQRWKSYKKLFSKHMQGSKYQLHLCKMGFTILRQLVPEEAKKPLRYLRDRLLSSAPDIFPFRSQFLDEMNKTDCLEYLLK